MDKITQINLVLREYFTLNNAVSIIPAKDMMPYFILAGIFPADHRDGLPIRALLRKLDENNQLRLIPFVLAERKIKNTRWYFRNSKKKVGGRL